MKFTKRMLAMVLTFALALSLALPAMAAVNWSDFRITKQPKDKIIKYGDSLTLSVEVNVPAGVEVEYQWYYFPSTSVLIENATTHELYLNPDHPNYPPSERLGGVERSFYCEITAYEKDGGGNVISSREIRSDKVNVRTERTALGKFLDVTIAPFGYAFTMTVMSPAFALIFPLSYLYFLILSYIQGFKALFS